MRAPVTLALLTTTVPTLLSTVRCDKLSACLDKLRGTLNFPQSVTNLRRLVTPRVLSTHRALVSQRAWHSITPTATPTAVQIVTAAVILSHLTDKTRRCTSRVIKLCKIILLTPGLTTCHQVQFHSMSNNGCIQNATTPFSTFNLHFLTDF